MSRVTICTCDRCGKEVPEEELCNVKIVVYTISNPYEGQLKAEWCLACCVETRLLPYNRAPKVQPMEQRPSLEDFVREIAYDEACNAISNRMG